MFNLFKKPHAKIPFDKLHEYNKTVEKLEDGEGGFIYSSDFKIDEERRCWVRKMGNVYDSYLSPTCVFILKGNKGLIAFISETSRFYIDGNQSSGWVEPIYEIDFLTPEAMQNLTPTLRNI